METEEFRALWEFLLQGQAEPCGFEPLDPATEAKLRNLTRAALAPETRQALCEEIQQDWLAGADQRRGLAVRLAEIVKADQAKRPAP